MDDQTTFALPSGADAVLRTRVTMKDKLLAKRVTARMMDMSLGDDNKPVVKIDMAARVELDEWLLTRFTVTVAGKPLDLDTIDIDDGDALIAELYKLLGQRLGIDPDTGFATDGAVALPKADAPK